LARPELADGGAVISRTLLTDAQSVEFAYFGAARADKVNKLPRWRDDWVNETALPQLIRIRVTLAADDARSWPELAIAPRVHVDAACVYDTLTKQCRGR